LIFPSLRAPLFLSNVVSAYGGFLNPLVASRVISRCVRRTRFLFLAFPNQKGFFHDVDELGVRGPGIGAPIRGGGRDAAGVLRQAVPEAATGSDCGLQTALLRLRMRAAVQAGCDVAVIVTRGGTTSERNAERLGFRLAYSKATLIKVIPVRAEGQ
jgi:hypothetical protein